LDPVVDPHHHQNLVTLKLGQIYHSLKISGKSVCDFFFWIAVEKLFLAYLATVKNTVLDPDADHHQNLAQS